jgi:Tfp pilus assembly protein PilF
MSMKCLRFVGLLPVLFLSCKHGPSTRDKETAQIHYELGINAQQSNNPQEALKELRTALALNPTNFEAHNAMGILLHLGFNKPEDAIAHYKRALELDPNYSEAKNNLGNVYLDLRRYDEAAKLYEAVLADLLYPVPYIAQGNLGWALYKKGDVQQGIEHLKTSVALNPKFCLGYKNLGMIYEEKGERLESCRFIGKYRDACPEEGDAYYREGVCLARAGKGNEARDRFKTCEAKTHNEALKEDCARLRKQLQ